ncbi:hypothetical protein J6590_029359 [Homalodisca vitripennis]|nr:hypothetical protein J6590_029359 [Homalodisca vitripennis]
MNFPVLGFIWGYAPRPPFGYWLTSGISGIRGQERFGWWFNSDLMFSVYVSPTFVNALNVSMTYPVSPRGGRQTWRPYIYIFTGNLFTSTRSFVLADPLAYCLRNQNGEFCFGRSPCLLPYQSERPTALSIRTESFVLAGPLAYCLVNHDGEFCLGRPPSLLPVLITTGSFVLAGPLAYCQC